MNVTDDKIYNAAYQKAFEQAQKAKPFHMMHKGKLYTDVFNSSQWVYDVYEDGVFLQSFNFKSANKCKAYLKQWLES
jgi:hypothetical protein